MLRVFLFSNPSEPTDEFYGFARDRFAKLLRPLGVRKHRMCEPLSDRAVPEVPVCEYDRVDEFWMDERDAALSLPDLSEYLEGESPEELMDPRTSLQLVTRPNPVIRWEDRVGPEGIKGVFLVTRKRGMSVADFQDYWGNKHAPLVPKTPELPRYTQYHVLPECYDRSPPPAHDGVSVLWWTDREQCRRSWLSEEVQVEQTRDAENFLEPPFPAMLVKESPVTTL